MSADGRGWNGTRCRIKATTNHWSAEIVDPELAWCANAQAIDHDAFARIELAVDIVVEHGLAKGAHRGRIAAPAFEDMAPEEHIEDLGDLVEILVLLRHLEGNLRGLELLELLPVADLATLVARHPFELRAIEVDQAVAVLLIDRTRNWRESELGKEWQRRATDGRNDLGSAGSDGDEIGEEHRLAAQLTTEHVDERERSPTVLSGSVAIGILTDLPAITLVTRCAGHGRAVVGDAIPQSLRTHWLSRHAERVTRRTLDGHDALAGDRRKGFIP